MKKKLTLASCISPLIAGSLLLAFNSQAVIKLWDGAPSVDCNPGGNVLNNGWGMGSQAAINSWCPNGVPTSVDDIVLDTTYIEIPSIAAVNTGVNPRSLTFQDNFNPLNTFSIQNNLAGARTFSIGNPTNMVQPMIQLNTTSGSVLFKRTGTGGQNLTVALLTNAVVDVVNTGVTLEFEAVVTGVGFNMTKIGAGTLLLSGAHTYSGGTTLSNGTLKVYTVFNGGGPFVAGDGTTFQVRATDASTPLKTSALTLGTAGAGLTCDLDLVASGSRTVPLVQATNLMTSGTITLNVQGSGFVTGQQVPLIGHPSAIGGAGFGAFHLGSLPSDVTASLVNNSNSLDLLILDAPSLLWTGSVNGSWDVGGTANWIDPTTSFAATYADGVGVRFDDSAAITSIAVNQDVAPGGITISNQTKAYDFSGSGKISGAFFKKQGAALVTLGNSVTNDYSGNTTVSAGTLKLGFANAIPGGDGKGNVLLDGALDLNGFSQTINGLTGSGSVVNNAGGAVTLSIGNGNASGAFTGSISEGSGTLALIKTNSGTQTLSGNNIYSGGTTIAGGILQLGADNTLGSGQVSVTGTAAGVAADAFARTLTNTLLLTIQTTFNTVSSGSLTLSGAINYNGANRIMPVEGLVTMTGPQSNGAPQKRGNGTLIVKGACDWTATAELRSGVTIFDGATVSGTGPVRPNSNIANGTSRMVVTNGTIINLLSTTANVRCGFDGDTTATNYLEIAGTMRTPQGVAPNGGVAIGVSPGYVTLLPGGDIEAYTIRIEPGAIFTSFSFDGGILRARADNSSFCQGLTEVLVRSRGANIDTAGWNIAIAQNLLDGGGAGGLTKLGAGTLRLNGTNTYTGGTVVSNGVFGGTGVIAGPVLVTSAGSFSPGNSVGTLTINNTLALQGTTTMELTRDNGAPESDLATGITTLNYGGTLVLTNTGTTALQLNDVFQLFSAATYSNSFTTITPPAGYTFDTSKLAVDGTVKVTGVPAGAQPQFSSFAQLGDGSFKLTFSGVSGNGYRVWGTTNIALTPIVDTWTLLSSGTFDGNPVEFIDAQATNNPTRFYTISVP